VGSELPLRELLPLPLLLPRASVGDCVPLAHWLALALPLATLGVPLALGSEPEAREEGEGLSLPVASCEGSDLGGVRLRWAERDLPVRCPHSRHIGAADDLTCEVRHGPVDSRVDHRNGDTFSRCRLPGVSNAELCDPPLRVAIAVGVSGRGSSEGENQPERD
jgi:hypothetical protein